MTIIISSLQEQMRQKDRLTEFVERCERNREILHKKVQHGTVMRTELENTMIETTASSVNDFLLFLI